MVIALYGGGMMMIRVSPGRTITASNEVRKTESCSMIG